MVIQTDIVKFIITRIIETVRGFKKFYLPILLILIGLMLYFGLNQKRYDETNNITWDAEGGVIFNNSSLIYSETGLPYDDGIEDFTIELKLKPRYLSRPDFQIILLLTNGSKEDQLLLGVWDHSLMVMSGYDYSHARKEPKLYVPLSEEEVPLTLRVECGAQGTIVYIDDKRIRGNSQLQLSLPPITDESRMTLGNNMYGLSPWTGTLYSLDLTLGMDSPHLSYDFTGPPSGILHGTKGMGPNLIIPRKRPNLNMAYLDWPNLREAGKLVMFTDIFLNFVGFMPLGALLYLLIRNSVKTRVTAAILLAFLFSLFLETAQVWLPGRDSSMLDLVLNTLGGAGGIYLTIRLSKYRP